jgi:hypothetical protein
MIMPVHGASTSPMLTDLLTYEAGRLGFDVLSAGEMNTLLAADRLTAGLDEPAILRVQRRVALRCHVATLGDQLHVAMSLLDLSAGRVLGRHRGVARNRTASIGEAFAAGLQDLLGGGEIAMLEDLRDPF